MFGRITAVQERNLGSVLAANVAVGDSTITVEDAEDFDATGTLIISATGAQLLYTAVDEDTGVITLDPSTLAAAAVTTDADDINVYVYPLTVERLATIVQGDNEGDEEGLLARIPHALFDRIPVGIRDGDGESVEAAYSGDELVVTDVTGQAPVVDGSFIDAATLPPAVVASDGLPPSATPDLVLTPGIGVLFAQWDGIANHDTVTYKVYVGDATGFTNDASTLYAETVATQVTIKTDPAGGALQYATPYFVHLVASDVDGDAAQTAEQTAQVLQASGPDIAVGSVTADRLVVSSALAAAVSAAVVTGGQIQTAASGQRTVLDSNGLTGFGADGSVQVKIPNTGSPVFNGQVTTGALTVQGGMLIQGATNAMDKGSAMQLNAQLGSATNAATVSFQYDSAPLALSTAQEMAGLDYDASGFGGVPTFLTIYTPDGSSWWLAEIAASDYSVVRTVELILNAPYVGGVCRAGSYIYIAYQSNAGHMVINGYNQSDGSLAASTVVSTSPGVNGVWDAGVGFGFDGTYLLLLTWASTATGAALTVNRYGHSAGAVTALHDHFTLSGGATRSSSASPLFNLGGITGRDGNLTICLEDSFSHQTARCEQYDATLHTLLTSDGAQWFPGANAVSGNSGEPSAGIAWDGTQYHGMCRLTPLLYHYSNWTWPSPSAANNTWWVGYTWFDGTGTTPATLSGITVASPAVATAAAPHGLSAGDEMSFTTTGALPTGLTVGTHYYVLSTGLTSTSFEVSATRGGTAIGTSGTQSGTHKFIKYHETKMSTLASVRLDGAGTGGVGGSSKVSMRGQLLMVTSSIPSDATAQRVYMVNGTASPSIPVKTTLLRQSPFGTSSDGSTETAVLRSYDGSGLPYADTNTFPSGTSTIFGDPGAAVTANWLIGGAGNFRPPTMTKAQRDAIGATQADLAVDPITGGGYLFDGSDWASISHVGRILARTIWTYSDFHEGTAGAEGVSLNSAGTGAAVNALSGVASHPGILRLTMGTSGSSAAYLTSSGSNGTGGWQPEDYASIRTGWLLRIPTLSNGTDTFAVFAGFADTMDGSTRAPSFGTAIADAGFVYTNALNGGKWQLQCGDLLTGSQSTADSGVTVVAGTWYFLEVVIASDVAKFYINGSLVGTITTHVPQSTPLKHGCGIYRSAGSTNTRTLDVDTYYTQADLLANRYG